MARPQKTGLEYFPLDVQLSDEVYAIECAYGNDGYAVVIKAWQALYQTDTGELDCTSHIRRVTLAKRANMAPERWTEIIDACVEVGIFDSEAWARGVLTSNGVKKRLERVMQEREAGRQRAARRWGNESEDSPADNDTMFGSYSPNNSAENPTGNYPENDAQNDAQNDTKERKGKKRKEEVQSTGEGGSAEGGKSPDVPAGKPLDNPGFSREFMSRAWPFYLKCKPGKGYKNRESQEVALRQLFKWCGGDEEEAKAAMGYSIANGYQGLNWYFEHKQRSGRNGNDSNAKHQKRAAHAAAFDKLIEQAKAREQDTSGISIGGFGADPGGQGPVVHGRAGAVILQLTTGKAAAEG